MTDARTQTAVSYFRAVEHSDGTPWVICEPQGGEKIEALSDGFVGFDLKPGTSLKDAEALAETLRRAITHVSVTTFLKQQTARP